MGVVINFFLLVHHFRIQENGTTSCAIEDETVEIFFDFLKPH
jgi:hypothetical protein